VFLQLEHEFANRWKAKLNVTHTDAQLERAWSTMGGGVDPVTLLGPKWRGGQIWAENKQDVVDVNLSGPFSLFGRTHELLVGADWQRVTSSWMTGAFPGNGTLDGNVFNPVPWMPSDMVAPPNMSYTPWGQTQVGGYGVIRLHPTDRLHIIAGARASKYDFKQRISTIANGVVTPFSDTSFSESTKVAPYGGIIYDLTDNWSAYLSYSTIYQPQALKFAGPKPGTPLKPIEGKSIEAGFKGELFDGKANATLSVFQVERTGTAAEDPAYPIDPDNRWGGMCCYLPQGKVTSQGYDAELAGQITPAWQAAVGYTFNVTRNKVTDVAYSSITPKHLLKASTAYTLPGALSQWQIGGNAQIQSMQYITSGTLRVEEPGRAVWGAMVKYTIDPTWTATLNVNNLFDKTYYRTISNAFTNNWYGTPRNWALTLRGKF
jgi:outer membrane receptor for ferric coprogen and ferric-rhodotorulic acid